MVEYLLYFAGGFSFCVIVLAALVFILLRLEPYDMPYDDRPLSEKQKDKTSPYYKDESW